MIASFGLAVIVYCFGVGAVCAHAAVVSRPRPVLVGGSLVLVELVLLVQAGIDVARLAIGRHAELATHVGYLVASVAVLPVVVVAVGSDEGRWASVALAIGCVVLAVVCVRLHQTG